MRAGSEDFRVEVALFAGVGVEKEMFIGSWETLLFHQPSHSEPAAFAAPFCVNRIAISCLLNFRSHVGIERERRGHSPLRSHLAVMCCCEDFSRSFCIAASLFSFFFCFLACSCVCRRVVSPKLGLGLVVSFSAQMAAWSRALPAILPVRHSVKIQPIKS